MGVKEFLLTRKSLLRNPMANLILLNKNQPMAEKILIVGKKILRKDMALDGM